MGRCDRRVGWSWKGIAEVAATCAATLALLGGGATAQDERDGSLLALSSADRGTAARPADGVASVDPSGPGASKATSPDATAVPTERLSRGAPAPAAVRARKAGTEQIDVELRRRLAEEERRRYELDDEWKERELLRLFRECIELPPQSIRLGPNDDLSPSASFLRAVSPLEDVYAAVDRQGFDRWAAKEIRRAWRRELAKDLARRYSERSSPFALLEMSEEADRMTRALDEAAVARGRLRFPAYWDAHPSAAPRDSRVEGEDIEVVRWGALTFDNELALRFDLRHALLGPEYGFESDYERRETWAARRTEAARRSDVGRPSEHFYAPPRGNIYEGSFCAIDGRIHLSTGLSAIQTGLLRATRTDLDFTFFSPYDGARWLTVELQVMYEPGNEERQVALMVELLRF